MFFFFFFFLLKEEITRLRKISMNILFYFSIKRLPVNSCVLLIHQKIQRCFSMDNFTTRTQVQYCSGGTGSSVLFSYTHYSARLLWLSMYDTIIYMYVFIKRLYLKRVKTAWYSWFYGACASSSVQSDTTSLPLTLTTGSCLLYSFTH